MAANVEPAATCSGGIACNETVRLESAFGSVCCQTGMTPVASSKDAGSAGAPFPGAVDGAPDGQATSVELTSGAEVWAAGSAALAAIGSGCS